MQAVPIVDACVYVKFGGQTMKVPERNREVQKIYSEVKVVAWLKWIRDEHVETMPTYLTRVTMDNTTWSSTYLLFVYIVYGVGADGANDESCCVHARIIFLPHRRLSNL
jgi:hypothetical protein